MLFRSGAVGGRAAGVWRPGGAAGLVAPAGADARGAGLAVAARDPDGAGPVLDGPAPAGAMLEDGAGMPAPRPAPAARGRCVPPPAVRIAVIPAEAASAASMATARTSPGRRGVRCHQPPFMGQP